MMKAVKSLKKTLAKIRRDEDGATMIEYSILIGLITVAAVVAIAVIGPWIATQWTTLQANLGL